MVKKTYNGEAEIDLIKLFTVLWKNVLAIILVAAMTAAAAFFVTYTFIKPTYKAETSMYVNNSSFSFGSTSFSISSSELSASNSLVQTYIFILKSRTTLEAVIKEAGIDYDYVTLRDEILKTEALSGTAAFKVAITSESPAEAELIANTIAKILPERISEIVDGASVRIVDYAIVPAHRASPSYTNNVLIGGLIGAFIASIWIIIRYIIRESEDELIHTSDELTQQYPKYPLLAVIPDMRLSEKKGYYYSSYYESPNNGGKR